MSGFNTASEDSHSEPPSILFLAPENEPEKTVQEGLNRHGIRVSVEAEYSQLPETIATSDVDCILASARFDGTVQTELLETVRSHDSDLPVVLLGEPPTETIENRFDADGAAEFVREDINTISFDTLASRIREFVATYRNRRARSVERDIVDRLENRIHETERRITALHGVAIRLNEAQTVDEVYRETTRAAEDILDLDVCFAFAAESDQFVPRARSTTSTDRELRPIPLDSGVMGKTYRTGTSERAVDMDVHDMAEPVFGEYKSGLSVPIGTFGVFQAVSKQPGAFDAIDLELTELLTAHAASVLQRLEFEDQLRIERDRFGALFENTADCIIEADFVDEEPIIQSVNPAFESVFGYEQSEVEGRSVDEVVVGEEEREEARTLTKQVRNGDVVQAEVRRQTTEGLKDFLLRSVPVEDDRLYGVYTDITEQKDNERTIKQKTDRLDKFASTISHDLRNPLNVAEGRLDIAREKGDNEHLQAVASAHSRIQALIDDLLTLAREGQAAQSIESLSLASVVDRCWVDIDGDQASLTKQTEQHISANESQLQQLLENLIGNAIEHSDGAVSVTVGDLDNGFYVEDDGPGIPADRRERVFEVGYTTAAEGTGFGLGIVHRIAEDHDWDVSVTEGTNGGTRVEITGVETAAE